MLWYHWQIGWSQRGCMCEGRYITSSQPSPKIERHCSLTLICERGFNLLSKADMPWTPWNDGSCKFSHVFMTMTMNNFYFHLNINIYTYCYKQWKYGKVKKSETYLYDFPCFFNWWDRCSNFLMKIWNISLFYYIIALGCVSWVCRYWQKELL